MQEEEDYNESIILIMKIFKGNIQEVIGHLNLLMKDLANQYKFEEAESIKQKILLLEKFRSKSTIVNPKLNIWMFLVLFKTKIGQLSIF